MNIKIRFKDVVSSLIIATALLATSAPSYSEVMGERSDERQADGILSRSGREQARDAKAACKEGDKSRSDCRQEKRDIKQESRDAGRDIRHD